MKRRIIPILIAGFCFIAAVAIVLYPVVSSHVNEKNRSEVFTAYFEQLDKTDTSELLHAKELADAYNKTIIPGPAPSDAYSKEALISASESYASQLNVTGSGIMAYIEIPKIGVHLPIYHGTDAKTLEHGIGHLLGSSLPVGGAGTHTVLSGHSGMASQKLFTDLTKLEQGDIYFLHVLGEKLAYRVTELYTVLPYDTSHLGIVPGQDLCTLVTCVPIGINSHRLLVRGERTVYEEDPEQPEQAPQAEQAVSSAWEDQYRMGILLGLGIILAAGGIVTVWSLCRRIVPKRKKGGKYLCKEKDKPFLRWLRRVCSSLGHWSRPTR